jgi:DNA-binding response OmpR family regulator
MLPARTEEIDRLKGLDIGADDYCLKPFSVKELLKEESSIKRAYHSVDEIVL